MQHCCEGWDMKRPKVTKEIVSGAAVDFCACNNWTEQQAEDLAEAYLDGNFMDGYKLGKALDDDYFWDMDSQTVDTLDGFDRLVREAHKKVCIAWARDNNIQPPLPVGAVTTKGVIAGIHEQDAACFQIIEHGETNATRFLIVRFEDACAA